MDFGEGLKVIGICVLGWLVWVIMWVLVVVLVVSNGVGVLLICVSSWCIRL